VCRLLGLSRQAVYQWKERLERHRHALSPVRDMVLYWRRFMPRIGARKLYHLMKPQLEEQGINLGRDGLFQYLKQENLLVTPRRNYTKTTNSIHWLRKHPNLFKEQQAEEIEQTFVSDITYVQSDQALNDRRL
jgi:putative transposase